MTATTTNSTMNSLLVHKMSVHCYSNFRYEKTFITEYFNVYKYHYEYICKQNYNSNFWDNAVKYVK